MQPLCHPVASSKHKKAPILQQLTTKAASQHNIPCIYILFLVEGGGGIREGRGSPDRWGVAEAAAVEA